MAVEYGVPILPCYIHGVRDILPKNRLRYWPGKMAMFIGELIDVPSVDGMNKVNQKKVAETLQYETRRRIEQLQATYS